MTDAILPASANDEIAAYSAARPVQSPLTDDIVAFLEAGQTVAVAAGSRTGYPSCAMGIGCVITTTATRRVRVFLSRLGNESLLAMVAAGGSVGMTLTGVDHRSIQVKAASGQVVQPTAADLHDLHRQVTAHREWLEIVGFSRAYAETLTDFADANVVGIEFLPERVYVQTPGPGAGSRLE